MALSSNNKDRSSGAVDEHVNVPIEQLQLEEGLLVFAGATRSGKTTLAVDLILNRKYVFRSTYSKVYVFYSVYQPENYDRIRDEFGSENFTAVEGFSWDAMREFGLLEKSTQHRLLLFDDVCYEPGICSVLPG